MKISTIKSETILKENKEIIFDNGVKCNYTLLNGKVTNFSFTKNNISLNVWIPEVINIEELIYLEMYDYFKEIKFEDEIDIVNFEKNTTRLFNYYGGTLKDIHGNPVKHLYKITYIDYVFMNEWNRKNSNVLTEWLKNQSDIEITDLEVVDTDWDSFHLNFTFKFNDPNDSLKYENVSEDGGISSFSTNNFILDLVNRFKKEYPDL